MVVSVSLRFIYSFLNSGYINPVQILSLSTPFMHELPLVWPAFYDIATFVLDLYSKNESEHAAFGLLTLVNFI
jgi:hypothetical protein